jgi:hypothetical protein
MEKCPKCGYTDPQYIPPEPPVGTRVRDKTGALVRRYSNGLWAQPGCVPLAQWEPMWQAWGPLTVVVLPESDERDLTSWEEFWRM